MTTPRRPQQRRFARLAGAIPGGGWTVFAVAGLVLLAGAGVFYHVGDPALFASFGRGGAKHAAERYAAMLAGAAILYGLTLLLWGILRFRPRKLVAVALAAALYLGIEELAMPHLRRPLRLQNYYAIIDPDHRPEGRTGVVGWNSDGLRQSAEAGSYRDEDFNIVFLGDSYTMGFGLDHPDREAFPTLVERALALRFPERVIRVANFGWVSSSPLLSYRRLVDIGAKYRPDLVVLCVDMTDPHDDIKWANLIERRGICALYDHLPFALQRFSDWFPDAYWKLYDLSVGGNLPYHRYFATEEPLEESRPFLEPMAKNIALIAEESARLGAGFAIIVLPRWFQYDERECPDDWEMKDERGRHTVLGPHCAEIFGWFEELGAARGYAVHSLLEDFRRKEAYPTCLPDDPHWNAQGHKFAARTITRALLPDVKRRLEASD